MPTRITIRSRSSRDRICSCICSSCHPERSEGPQPLKSHAPRQAPQSASWPTTAPHLHARTLPAVSAATAAATQPGEQQAQWLSQQLHSQIEPSQILVAPDSSLEGCTITRAHPTSTGATALSLRCPASPLPHLVLLTGGPYSPVCWRMWDSVRGGPPTFTRGPAAEAAVTKCRTHRISRHRPRRSRPPSRLAHRFHSRPTSGRRPRLRPRRSRDPRPHPADQPHRPRPHSRPSRRRHHPGGSLKCNAFSNSPSSPCPRAPSRSPPKKLKSDKQHDSLDQYVKQIAVTAPAPTVASGSLFTATGPLADPCSDLKAHAVGDTLSIQIVESTTISQTGTVATERDFSHSSAITGVGGQTPSYLNPLLAANSSTKLAGTGATNSQSSLNTVLTALVVAVLPNGLLVVEAQPSTDGQSAA